jgi:proline iminopeptidase
VVEPLERTVDVNGARLWVTEEGAGPALILCNGGPGCGDYLAPVSAMLNDVACVYRFEPRGCGRSSPEGPFDVATCVSDLDALRQEFGHERWIVGGHSAGADLALAYALAHPDRTRALICIAGGRVHNDRDWHAAYSAARDAGLEQPLSPEPPVNREVNRHGNDSWKAFIKQPGLLRRIAELQVPALFVYASEDIRPSWPVEQVAQLMPQARFEQIDGAGHNIWQTHADALRERLRPFVTSLP